MTGARILGTFHYGYTVAPGGKICYTALYNGYPTQGKGGADMKKRIALCLIALLLLLPAAGCGEKKNTDPLTVTLWHVYGGEVDSPLNGLIERFNSTIGVEKNIRVKVELVSNSGSIHKSVLAAANSDPGAPTLPDMFVSYPKTVLALPDEDILVDYRDYLSDEELGAFLPAFLEEGQVNGRQVILPIAKSTEVLFINRTLFDRWAAASGASYDDLATWEGIYALAERYAADTGKCFLVNDYHFNYFQVGVTSLGEDFFQNDGVRFGSGFERAWEPYAHAALEGGVWLQDGYATESLRTGDTIASVASSASVLYYSDTVTYPDNTSEKVSITSLPYPVFEGGEKLVMQRGVGMCTTKSTPEREKACITSEMADGAGAERGVRHQSRLYAGDAGGVRQVSARRCGEPYRPHVHLAVRDVFADAGGVHLLLPAPDGELSGSGDAVRESVAAEDDGGTRTVSGGQRHGGGIGLGHAGQL